ncbi:MAG: 2-oxoacid:acceptor oxidoreductase subunit alpha [Methanoregula sp.]|nr:2-oxoacid:acceptor oxidoreductase subunit alpha [Methanoregula sp.]
MNEVSVLIGGKAGDGINSAGAIIAQLLNHLGYRIYLYFDYPSLIRGGHNFAIIRGFEQEIGACRNPVDFVLALNEETLERHNEKFTQNTVIIANKDLVKNAAYNVPVKVILAEENAPVIMGNSALIGGFAKVAGIDWDVVDAVFRRHIPKGADQNLAVARKAYNLFEPVHPIKRCENRPQALVSGNEAIGLGLIRGGLEAYVSYPMTPSSGILHFLAEEKERFGITVVHPENEIAVILMALGFAYGGRKAAIGTSGGGFCLMTEGLSLAGMAEIPLVIVVSQRTGPSTGLPTYTGQTELQFVLHAGHGEFPRLIVAPGDAQEALDWSERAMDIAWKCQVPAFILVDKTLSEGIYSLDPASVSRDASGPGASLWDSKIPYRRYENAGSGISPMAFPGAKDAVVKVNSYLHDEAGITAEDAVFSNRMTEKRLKKRETLTGVMQDYSGVVQSGKSAASTSLLCWGSTKGVCEEAAAELGLRVVRPIVLTPFPADQIKKSLAGVNRLIAVEENATGQLAALAGQYGIIPDVKILRCDGRPFTVEDLVSRVMEAGI